MAEKVFKVFLARRTEAWYALTEKERDILMEKVADALQKANGKRVVICNSTWATEQWQFFGVEEFPDFDAAQLHSALLDDIDLRRYVKSLTTLGTEWHT